MSGTPTLTTSTPASKEATVTTTTAPSESWWGLTDDTGQQHVRVGAPLPLGRLSRGTIPVSPALAADRCWQVMTAIADDLGPDHHLAPAVAAELATAAQVPTGAVPSMSGGVLVGLAYDRVVYAYLGLANLAPAPLPPRPLRAGWLPTRQWYRENVRPFVSL